MAYDDEDYLAFTDDVAARLAPAWSPTDGYYRSGSPALDSRFNAAMLLVHATAARYGHVGAARDDERARRLAEVLTASPPFSYQEVSATLGIAVGSIGPIRQRCLRRLRVLLGRRGFQ